MCWDEGAPDGDDIPTTTRSPVGSRATLAALYDEHGARCYSLARCILGDDRLAEDTVRQVFLAVRHAATGGSVAAWLLTQTHRTAVDAVRREGRPAAQPALDRPNEALPGLPPAQREVLVLAFYGGYTQREIADLTGAPLSTVTTRMLSAMRRLRTEMQHEPPDAEQEWSAP